MEMSWSHTPSSVWWALETSSTTSLEGGQNSTVPPDSLGSIRTRSPTLRPRPQMPGKEVTNFYDYAGEPEEGEDLKQWILREQDRGAIRVYQTGSTYSELVSCTLDTTADTIIARCLAKELHVHYGSGREQSLQSNDKPLEIQNQFLRSLGYTDLQRIQLVGLSEDLGPLFRFVTGYEQDRRPEEKVQLACALRVKEMAGFGGWNKRFCVLCGARLFIFSSSRPKGKPSLVLDLTGGKMTEHRIKRSYYCVKVSASRRDVLLSFDTRLEQSKWLERAAKVVSKHPLEANLSGKSLERVPKYFFLNYYLVAMNLSRNRMTENYTHTVTTTLGSHGKARVIGWINDLSYFRHLVSLSLSDNHLTQFPVSLCALKTLQELDISRNRIKVIPQEIQRLTSLTTLLLHSNQLNSLPRGLIDLKRLGTLVLAFNLFIELPPFLKDVSSLSTLIVSGNNISTFPDNVSLIENLRHLDYRLNTLKAPPPSTTRDLSSLSKLNLRGTNIREINTKYFPVVEELNCADNRLRNLVLFEGPLKTLIATNNSISQFNVAPTCNQLTSINISRNKLVSLPEPLTGLCSLQKLDASQNKLTTLPAGIFTLPELEVLQVSDNHITSLPATVREGCGLQLIDLHGNQITSLPQQLIMRTPDLHTLNVSSNHLSVLPLVSPHGTGPSLTTLLAADNRLGDGVLLTISCCKNLKVLHLGYNSLQTILPSTFVQLKQLEYLNLSGNHTLSSFPSLPHCFNLHTLSLHSTLITALPETTPTETTPPLRCLVNLDLAGNRLTQLPKLVQFGKLKYLDLSDNVGLKIKEEDVDKLKPLLRCVLEGELGIHSDARMMSQVECNSAQTHNLWNFGSAQTPGVGGGVDCTMQVKASSLVSGKDGLFAIINGGRSVDAPKIIQEKLADLLMEEFSAQVQEEAEPRRKDTPTNSLSYLKHTFLTAHQMLGEVGCSYGCSMVLCHIHILRSKKLVLNVANAGLGEAILCRSGHAVPLTTTHSPATNREERERIKQAGGFISQDYRVNGVCGTTRLLGCYHLGPEVIPAPSTASIVLQPGDDYIIIGTDSLWKHVTHERAVHVVTQLQDASAAARKLRDLVVGYGCKVDVSVIVVKVNVTAPDGGVELEKSRSNTIMLESGSDQNLNEEEDVEFTNIDDIISDGEDDMEQRHESTWNGDHLTHSTIDIDQMILNAVSSPPTSPISPQMKSTNIDDIITSPRQPTYDHHKLHSVHTSQNNRHTTTTNPEHGTTTQKTPHRGGEVGVVGRKITPTGPQPLTNNLGYPAQTIPRDAAGSRSKGGDASPPPPPSQAIDYTQFRDSFEVTQSAPMIPANQSNDITDVGGIRKGKGRGNDVIGRRQLEEEVGFGGSLQREKPRGKGGRRDVHERGLRGKLTERDLQENVGRRGENMEGYLSKLNQVLTDLDSDSLLGDTNKSEPPKYGGKIQRRLSYVEHSYQQLTNNVYSEGAIANQHDNNYENNYW